MNERRTGEQQLHTGMVPSACSVLIGGLWSAKSPVWVRAIATYSITLQFWQWTEQVGSAAVSS